MIKVQGQRVIDSGGGFLIEENDELEQQMVYNTYRYDYIQYYCYIMLYNNVIMKRIYLLS